MFLLSKEYWEIQKIKKIGKGVYAKKDIPAGTVIGDYIGKVIPEKEEDKYDNGRHFYLMYYHERASIYPNVRKPGIHLINHSCTPNCWMSTYMGHTLYFAIRHIFKGEELTVSYLLASQDKDCSPCDHLCDCGSMICTQTMHISDKRYDLWDDYEKIESKRTKRQRVHYGKTLPVLKKYPENIPDQSVYTLFGNTKKEPLQREDTSLPSTTLIRSLIRESGRTLVFPKIKMKVFGVQDGLLTSEVTT